MKYRIAFAALITFSQFYFSQSRILSKIDSLETEKEVETFIRSCSKTKDDFLSEFELKTIQSFDDNNLSQKIKREATRQNITKSFYKGDFDHNGRTDLIFIGDDKSCTSSQQNKDGSNSCNTSTKVIFDLGNSFSVKNLQPNHNDFVIPKVSKINGKDYITIFYEETSFFSDSKILSKTLDFQFDHLIEYNPTPKNYSIKKIAFKTGMCFGTCPAFWLELNKEGNSKFIAEAYNFINENDPKAEEKTFKNLNKGKKEGTFETKIKIEDFNELEKILTIIDFPQLKDSYHVNWTDDQTSYLAVTYDNGKVKNIQDYGLVGTYGLRLLYKKLFDIRFNQDWQKVK